MGLDNLVRDSKSKAGASGFTRARLVYTEEAFEQVGQILWRNAAALILYTQLDCTVSPLHTDMYALSSEYFTALSSKM